MIGEVKYLMDKGYDLTLSSMSGIGYTQVAMYLTGKMALSEAIEKIKNETHRFARKQYAWFHLDDDRIHWFDICTDFKEKVEGLMSEFITYNATDEIENDATNN